MNYSIYQTEQSITGTLCIMDGVKVQGHNGGTQSSDQSIMGGVPGVNISGKFSECCTVAQQILEFFLHSL